MENEAVTPAAPLAEDVRPSYWLDACEDISCDLADFDACAVPDSVDNVSGQDGLVNDFFGGIDHILESIKNGGGLPLHQHSGSSATVNGADGWFQNDQSGDSKTDSEGSFPQPDRKEIAEKQVLPVGEGCEEPCKRSEVVNGDTLVDANGERRLVHSSKENGVQKVENRGSEVSRERTIDGEERLSKRARLGNYKNERCYSSRVQYPPRDFERCFGRKRPRDWDEIDRRDRDNVRRREHYSSNRRDGRDRDWRDREAKGYWERDRSGSSDMVFRLGSWEADRNKEGKVANEKSQECDAKAERKSEETKVKIPQEHARQYQLDVLEQAKKKNTIAFLETGAGKTLIAVLLIKSICHDLQKQNKKMLSVFLVPKVPLVYQQAEVIRERTGFIVGHYCGEMGQDFWDARRWQREFETKQVLVMTAQILLNILRHSIIKMEAINLLILDECHHAVKKHPYSLVMSEFYHTTPKDKRPSVFGMTASPVNLKGVSSQVDCAIKIRNLESKLDSIVCTIKDRKELEKHVPMPSEIVVDYDKAASLWSLHEQIKQMEAEVEEAAKSSSRRSKWQFMGARDAGAKEELRQVYGVSERTESDGAANLIQKLRAINYALDELGQWCAYKVAQSFLTALQNDERANYQLDVKFQESYLNKVVSLLQCQLSEGAVSDKDTKVVESGNGVAQDRTEADEIEEGELPDSHVVSGGEHVDVIIGAAVADGKVTPKVQSLIKILLKYQNTEDFRAIIFVERVVSALVLPKVFAELPSLGFIRCASLIGHNNSHEMRTCQMQDTIAKFKDGRVTLLVATSVAEEGLDIRQCNVVIRFDLAKTVLAYIQSRGRARKPGSDYILMVERGNLSHEAFLRNARNSTGMETQERNAVLSLFTLFVFLSASSSAPLQYQTLVLNPLSTQQETVSDSLLSESSELDPDSSNTTLLLHHIDGLSSDKTPKQLFQLRLQRDALRVKALTSLAAVVNGTRLPGPGGGFSSSVVSGLSQGSGEYFTRIGVGTPPKYVYMVLDTGSDIVWLQCAPCKRCYSQTDPIFDPSKSRSYAGISCASPLCRRLDSPGCNTRKTCLYQVSYGDGSFTVGDFLTETLTFRRSRVGRVALGCGHDNEGLFVGAAGLLGLGRGKLSFPSQTGRRFNRKFSYCLVDRSASSRPSSVVFGDAAISRTARFTPLLANPRLDTFYYVELLGISVGGRSVPGITAQLFKLGTTGNGGVIIDSGTSVTRLTRSAYVALRDAFRVGASRLKRAPDFSLFDTCFDLSGKTSVKVPTVVLHFRGVDVSLPATNYLIPVDTDGTFCFAFAATMSGLSIIGNIQQQGFRVVYDLAGSRVGFAPRGCA